MSAFIVFEGLDGAGTTTQAARLVHALVARGEVIATREPTDGPIGRLLRATLRGEPGAPAEVALPWLFAADRAEHLALRIEPALARGAWVVSDRYYHSTLAYQSLLHPLERLLPLNPFRAPDLTVFLRVPVEVGLERVRLRGGPLDIFEEETRQRRIYDAYEAVIRRLVDRGERVAVIDGTQPIEAVAAEALAQVDALPRG